MAGKNRLFSFAVLAFTASFLALALSSCGSKKKEEEAPKPGPGPSSNPPLASAPKVLRIMSYNLHNLFDSHHDIVNGVDKNDWEYLPEGFCDEMDPKPENCGRYDWTDGKYRRKLEQLKFVFDLRKEATGQKEYPDLVAFSEIENAGVLQDIANMLGYPEKGQLISESPDRRGIDIAFMFRPSENFHLVSSRQVNVLGLERPTRPILEAEFMFNGNRLFAYSNHWPSQWGCTGKRNKAAIVAATMIQNRKKEFPEAQFISMGDFNTTEIDSTVINPENGRCKPAPVGSVPHPFYDVFLAAELDDVSLLDVQAEAKKKDLPVAIGTYYYFDRNDPHANPWEHLDRFFVSSDLLDGEGTDIHLESFEVFNHDKVTRFCTPFEVQRKYCGGTREIRPTRYNHNVKPNEVNEQGEKIDPGHSDHYAIYVDLISK